MTYISKQNRPASRQQWVKTRHLDNVYFVSAVENRIMKGIMNGRSVHATVDVQRSPLLRIGYGSQAKSLLSRMDALHHSGEETHP